MGWGCLPEVGVWLGGGLESGRSQVSVLSGGPVRTISQRAYGPPEDTRADTEWTRPTDALGEKCRPTSFCHWTEFLEGRDHA